MMRRWSCAKLHLASLFVVPILRRTTRCCRRQGDSSTVAAFSVSSWPTRHGTTTTTTTWSSSWSTVGDAARRDDDNHDDDDALFADVERVFALSDLHTDDAGNLAWLRERCQRRKHDDDTPGPRDVLVVAGDVSHDLAVLDATFALITASLGCRIFFVPGNHEAWVNKDDDNDNEDSLSKLQAVEDRYDRNSPHVFTGEARLVGTAHATPVWLVPLRAWYDGSLSLTDCDAEFCPDFRTAFFPWVDFVRCRWPAPEFAPYDDAVRGKIPRGLAEHLIASNEKTLQRVRPWFDGTITMTNNNNDNNNSTSPGLLTFSHFLPHVKTLPDWKDVDDDTFRRDAWLDHGAGSISVKFAKVAGSSLLDAQIRSVGAYHTTRTTRKHNHLHVFGHSHRPKDVSIDGIRYVHNPLGKPREREMNMVAKDVDFQLLWDTTTPGGEVAGEGIVRYWEEQGGGLEALRTNMARRKRQRQKAVAGLRTTVGRSSSTVTNGTTVRIA